MSIMETLVEQVCMDCPNKFDIGVCDSCSLGEVFDDLTPEKQRNAVLKAIRQQKGENNAAK